MKISYLLGISLLCGTIIGVGVFSLPYAFLKFGPLASVFYLFLVFILRGGVSLYSLFRPFYWLNCLV